MAGMGSPLSSLAPNSPSKHSRSCWVFAFTLAHYEANLYVNLVEKQKVVADQSSHKEVFSVTIFQKGKRETKGYQAEIGFDGWPIDRNHPVYGRK
jgi:hypothetical protein